MISAVILILLFLIFVLLCLRFFFPELYLLLFEKIAFQVLEFEFQSNIRYFAWRAALSRFFNSPIFGVGIGDQFEFLAYNSQGLLYTSRLTTHNIILSILYQTGIIGATLFVMINLRILAYMWRQLPLCDSKYRGLIAGMIASYLGALAMAMFQPLLESPGAVVAFYLWVGIMLKATDVFADRRKLHLEIVGESFV
jgi:O-antigen ligase